MRSFRRELKSLLKNIRGYRVLGYGPEVWGRYAPVMARITSSPCIIGHDFMEFGVATLRSRPASHHLRVSSVTKWSRLHGVWGRYAPVMARITSSPCIIGHEMVTTSWSLGSLRSGHGPQTEELAHKKVDVIVIKMTRLHPKYPYFKLV